VTRAALDFDKLTNFAMLTAENRFIDMATSPVCCTNYHLHVKWYAASAHLYAIMSIVVK